MEESAVEIVKLAKYPFQRPRQSTVNLERLRLAFYTVPAFAFQKPDPSLIVTRKATLTMHLSNRRIGEGAKLPCLRYAANHLMSWL